MKYFQNVLFVAFVGLFSLTTINAQEAKINWMSWEEAVEANKKEPKKVFIDVYTDWCGWCKKMDKSTFVDDSVIEAINKDFYAVKFNAEQKSAINFNGSEFKFVNQGRRGVHQLAYALLDGRMGYPAFVFLDESFSRIMISPGYKQAPQILKELQFSSSEAYKETSWEDFSKTE